MSDDYKMSGPSAIDRILSFLQTLVLTAITVILALLLVEIKKFTNEEKGITVSSIGEHVNIVLQTGYPVGVGSQESQPFYIRSAGSGDAPGSPLYVEVRN